MSDVNGWISRANHVIYQLERLSMDAGRIHDCRNLIGGVIGWRDNVIDNPKILNRLKDAVIEAEEYTKKIAREIYHD